MQGHFLGSLTGEAFLLDSRELRATCALRPVERGLCSIPLRLHALAIFVPNARGFSFSSPWVVFNMWRGEANAEAAGSPQGNGQQGRWSGSTVDRRGTSG